MVVFFLAGVIGLSLACNSLDPWEPEGACKYGPGSSLIFCVNGTTKKECVNDFGGTWFEGKNCSDLK